MPKIDVSNEVIAKLSDDATKALVKQNAALNKRVEVLSLENAKLKEDKEKVKRLLNYFLTIAEDLQEEFPFIKDENW